MFQFLNPGLFSRYWKFKSQIPCACRLSPHGFDKCKQEREIGECRPSPGFALCAGVFVFLCVDDAGLCSYSGKTSLQFYCMDSRSSCMYFIDVHNMYTYFPDVDIFIVRSL